MRVLVAAASKHGATQGIADAIGRTLAGRGVEVDVRRIEDLESVDGYDALVLGSAVYAGRWLEPARQLVERHRDAIAARPTWLFSSGPIGEPPKPAADEAVQIGPILEQTGAREHRLFSGKVDKDALGFGERAVMVAVRARAGDYRDWDEIAEWAAEIARELEP